MTVVPMVFGSALAMIFGSLVSKPPSQTTIEKYFGQPKTSRVPAAVTA
jgi:hypothetical protein